MATVTYGLSRPFSHGLVLNDTGPITSPAAGAGFTYTVGGEYWEMWEALTFTLVTDANAATRQVFLTIQDQDSVPLARIPAGGTQITGLTRVYSFVRGITTPQALVVDTFLSPLPDLILQTGWKVVVSISSVQVGDQVSLIRAPRVKFVTGDDGYPLGPVDEAKILERAQQLGN